MSEQTLKAEGAQADAEARLYLASETIAPRVINAAITTAITAYWLHGWAVLWFGAYLVFEHVITPFVIARFVAPRVENGQGELARKIAAVHLTFGAATYVIVWASAWLVGGAEAGLMAGLFIAGTLQHAVIYFSSSRMTFLACCGPALVCAFIAPFFVSSNPLFTLVSIVGVMHAVLAAWAARAHRNQITQYLLEVRGQMKVERDASLAKSQFLATMSHELRTPLNAVIGYAEILEEELTEDGRLENANDAARIRRSARDLLVLINEVLDFSKIEAGRMDMHLDDADVSAVIADVVETTAHIAVAHNTKVIVDIAPEAANIVTDPQRLRQCVLNLVSNAAKFTDDGEIAIRAGIERKNDVDFLRIEVVDTGCGISADDQTRLFQPFVQADGSFTRKRGGTGLGLVITKRLAQLLGGDVTFTSAEGNGSHFTLVVRAYGSEALVCPVGEGPTVLVVEDEAHARDIMRRSLARLPFQIVEAGTASEGFAKARERTPALIVLDLHLPDRSGWELLAEFKANPTLQNVPVLVVSIDDDRARALRLGACDHLVKPVDREKLASSVLRYARSEASPLSGVHTAPKSAANAA